MIRIYAETLTTEDRKFLNRAVVYTLDHLTSRRLRKNTDITINLKPLKGYQAETEFKLIDGRRKFNIDLTTKAVINAACSTPLYRFRTTLIRLFHELVHVKQFLKGELVQFQNIQRFQGQTYRLDENDDLEYLMSPWEREARYMEDELWVRFKKHVKEMK